MHYLVDGHNLIGQMPNIALDDPDDEAKLIALLHRWTLRNPRDRITVIFDNGVYGHPGQRAPERVEVIFARSPSDADARLIKRLRQLPRTGGVTLISTDRAITTVAAERGVVVKPSRMFASEMAAERRQEPGPVNRVRPEPKLARTDVDAWLRAFGAEEDGA